MKKKILLVAIVACLLCGCEKTIPKLDNGEEAVVSFKDGSMISVKELYDELKDSYATQTLIDMIDKKILTEKYKDKKKDAEEYASSNIEQVKTYYTDENGKYDEAALINALNQYYGYTSIEEYEENLQVNYYRNQAIEAYAKTLIKENDIKKYYKDEIVGDREVSHIQIIPEVKDSMTDDEKKKAEDDALAKAKEVITKLKKGEKFEALAKEYSSDDATKDKGGSLGYINKGTYGSDEFDKEVYSLELGKYSTTPVKTSDGYEIVYVTKEKDKKSLEKVRDDIVETLAKKSIEEDATIQINALKELRKEYGVDIIDADINKDYNKKMTNMLDAALQQNTSGEQN